MAGAGTTLWSWGLLLLVAALWTAPQAGEAAAHAVDHGKCLAD